MIELSAVLRQLRCELTAAMADGEQETLRFELGPVEVETSVTVDREADGNGKVRFWLAEAGAEGKLAHSQSHRIKLTLQPAMLSGGVRVTALVSGDELGGER
ncbi:trypco2 family protein [Streptomyces cinnamoneus]|uniref:trypco2 family protein n=1 Tax=Streptomyces cinnamoneus TaxID=53446 RepID=UPI00343CCA95